MKVKYSIQYLYSLLVILISIFTFGFTNVQASRNLLNHDNNNQFNFHDFQLLKERPLQICLAEVKPPFSFENQCFNSNKFDFLTNNNSKN